MKLKDPKDRIIVALDMSDPMEAAIIIEELAPHVGYFKIGLEMITVMGAPAAVQLVHTFEGQVVYDGKFHDIPTTMAKAVKAAAKHGVKMLTVHASAGTDSMIAAVENKGDALVLAVTVLTSMTAAQCYRTYHATVDDKVLDFAVEAINAGVDGIICSPLEVSMLRALPHPIGMIFVTPGVRPVWMPPGDQQRYLTPGEAIKAGADFLVIGRPITNPPEEIGSRLRAVELITAEITDALASRR